MINFIDEYGKQHSAIVECKKTKGVNGEKSLSGTIYTNNEILEGIGRGWRLQFEDENYCLTYVNPIDEGTRIVVEFDAVHEFFFDLKKSVIYSEMNGSNTADAYLRFIFNGSGYDYRLEINIPAFEKESFGMKNRLDLFKDFISSTGAEFSVSGKVVRILEQVGTNLSTIVKKGFNLNELRIEKDPGSFITYLKGYGAFVDPEDESKGRLIVEYLSPLAEIYGKLEGDPIIDERYKIESNFIARLKKDVEESYGISVNIDMVDLTQAGYKYDQPHEGDYIMAINKDLEFEQQIRIMSYTTSYDTEGNVVDHDVSCGSDSLVKKQAQKDDDYRKEVQAGLEESIKNSNSAMVAANGKNKVFMGPDEPTATAIGDIWYQIDGEQTIMKYWNGYEWVPFINPDEINNAIEEVDKNAEDAKNEAEQATDSANKAVSDATHAVSVADQSKASADEAKADAANAITNANQAIKDAADSLAELEVVKDTVQDININIDEINNSLSLKVSQVDFDKLEGTVKTQATQINANAEQITLKANQSDVNTIDGKVSMVESTLTTQAGQITALNTKTDGMNTQIGSLQSSYDGLSSTISQVQTDLDGKATVEQFTNLSQTVDVIQLTVADKASQSQVTLLSDQITSVVGGLTPNLVLNGDFQTNGQGWINPNNIGTFYSVSADDKTNGAPFSAVNKVRAYASDIIASGSNWDLVSNVSTRNGSYDYLAGKQMRVSFYYSNNGAASDVNAWQCYVRIRKSDGTNWYPSLYLPLAKTGWVRADFLVDLKNYKAGEIAGITVALKGFVANLNNTNLYATALMISEGGTLLDWGRDYARGASYSQITQLTDMINLRVAKEDVINQINISPESILIAGNKVQITGQTYIENGVIGTAQIKDAAITDAKIGSLSANKITTGSLNAANVNIINMNASNIVTGELTGITLRSSANGSSFYVRGNELFMQKANGDHLTMDTSGIYWYNSKGDILFQSSKKLTTSDIFGTAEYNAYLAAFNETRSVTYATALTGSGGVNDYNYLYHRARGFYGNLLEVNTGVGQTNVYLRPASAENEVRVTVAGGTDSYARLRAGSLMGNWLSINTATDATHLYLQAKDEVRIVNIGEGNLTNNATYMKLRASKLFANALSVNDFTSGENLYLQAKDEVRVKNVSADASSAAYKAIRASAFNTSSLAEYKTNIERFEKSALDIIGQSTIYSYNLKGDIETDEIGLVIGEGYSIAQEVVNGDGVSQYRMNSLSWKAIQELHKKIKDLENELAVLKSA
ncbi:phage tail protein [Enterococcus thailandicus]|uniref:phage tail protein n=1 Tax=Enterococcus thailandicus TaxID=417368 RepID=UPI0022E057FB|nr:phage tail protein [Enterococcus thailandicus]